jgi:hypothetical protein
VSNSLTNKKPKPNKNAIANISSVTALAILKIPIKNSRIYVNIPFQKKNRTTPIIIAHIQNEELPF